MISLLSSGVQAEGVVQVGLKSEIIAQARVIRLKDIIDTQVTDVEFTQQYGDLVVCEEDDEIDKISSSRLYALLLKAGADVDQINFRMNQGVFIERGQKITVTSTLANKIAQNIMSHYGVPSADVKVEDIRILPKLDASLDSDALVFKSVEASNLKSLNNSKFNVVIENPDGDMSEHEIFVKLSIETQVAIAKEALEPGTYLKSEHYVVGRQKLKSLTQKIAREKDLNSESLKVVRSIVKDEILTAEMTFKSEVVSKGAVVNLSYKTSLMTISTMGKLLDASEVGQVVHVENVDSQRTVTGRLVSKELVEVASVN